ncbi:MAG: putative capsid protein [Cressdnaviricota sp.]|nr:MAG: putative capsid protein [Cressdnaviricota sp.]
MANVRYSRRSTRRPNRSARSTIRGKPKASKNKSAIYKLTKQVNKIQRTVSSRTQRLTYSQQQDFNLSENYTVKSLTPLSSWTKCFGDNLVAQQSNKLTCKSASLKYTVYAGDEQALVDITVCVLTPKSLRIYNQTNGMNDFVEGTDYVSVANGTCVLVNLKRFKLHYYKRHQTSIRGTSSGTGFYNGVCNMGSIKLRNKNWVIKNTVGDWDDVSITQLPYYMHAKMVVFNNNAGGDLEFPALRFANIWQCIGH